MNKKKYKPFRITRVVKAFGFDRHALVSALTGGWKDIRDFVKLKKQKGKNQDFYFGSYYPCFTDRKSASGTMRGHYFHQDLLIARRIYTNKPIKHLDIGSRTDGFIAHLAVFRKVDVMDIRDQTSMEENINFRKADLMQLPVDIIDSYDSISALHSIEHFGLGRYNDPVDYDGYKKAIVNITKILQKGGKFYFSVPIGSQRIEFNAHRIFDVKFLIDILSSDYKIDYFSYVDDEGDLHLNASLNQRDVDNNYDCNFGCGIFELTKL